MDVGVSKDSEAAWLALVNMSHCEDIDHFARYIKYYKYMCVCLCMYKIVDRMASTYNYVTMIVGRTLNCFQQCQQNIQKKLNLPISKGNKYKKEKKKKKEIQIKNNTYITAHLPFP